MKYFIFILFMMIASFASARTNFGFSVGTEESRFDFEDIESSILVKSNFNPIIQTSFQQHISRRVGYLLNLGGTFFSVPSNSEVGLSKSNEFLLKTRVGLFLRFQWIFLDASYYSDETLIFSSTADTIFIGKSTASLGDLGIYFSGRFMGSKMQLGFRKSFTGSLVAGSEGSVKMDNFQVSLIFTWKGKRTEWGLNNVYKGETIFTSRPQSSRSFKVLIFKRYLF